jgi:hypothetical protein
VRSHSFTVVVYRRHAGTWTVLDRFEGLTPARLALEGDTLVVGLPFGTKADRTPAAIVFAREDGRWREQARITPSPATPKFGVGVALRGDTLAVASEDAIHVLARDRAAWHERAVLRHRPCPERDGECVSASSSAPGSYDDPTRPPRFTAVALSADRLIATVYHYRRNVDGFYLEHTQLHPFVRDGEGWQAESVLDLAKLDAARVELDGTTLVIGAPAITASDRHRWPGTVFVRDLP